MFTRRCSGGTKGQGETAVQPFLPVFFVLAVKINHLLCRCVLEPGGRKDIHIYSQLVFSKPTKNVD